MFVLVITRLGALFINHLRHLADPLRERRLGDSDVPPAAVFVHHGLRQHFNINQSADRFTRKGICVWTVTADGCLFQAGK